MKLKYTFCFLLLFCFQFEVSAEHIIGGTASYEVVKKDLAKVTLYVNFILYKESGTSITNFDNPANIGVYGVSNNEFEFVKKIKAELDTVEEIEFDFPEACPELFYEKATYSFEVILFYADYEYYTLVYQRCCRTGAISNIYDPELTGYPLSLDIYPRAFDYNEKAEEMDISSIPFLLGVQDNHEIDLSIDDAYDIEYKLTIPSIAGGIAGDTYGDPTSCEGLTPDPTFCPPPFDFVTYKDGGIPYGTGSEVDLDTELGKLSIQIPTVGMTLFEMTIDRYRDGEILSSINNQWTTITSTCTGPVSVNDDSLLKNVNLFPNPSSNTIHLSNTLTDIVILDDLGNRLISLETVTADEGIPIRSFNPGIYILKGINKSGDVIILKFIKV